MMVYMLADHHLDQYMLGGEQGLLIEVQLDSRSAKTVAQSL